MKNNLDKVVSILIAAEINVAVDYLKATAVVETIKTYQLNYAKWNTDKRTEKYEQCIRDL